MTLDGGDLLESSNAAFIRERLPAYEQIWSRYIGHDGKGKLINLPHLTPDQSNERIVFAERHYTVLESIICMKELLQENYIVNDISTYLNVLNKFICFYAHAGRIRDNMEKLITKTFGTDKSNLMMQRLEDIYQQRNNALHGKKVPIRIIDTMLIMPFLKGNEEAGNNWHSDLTWAELKNLDENFLNDTLKTLFELVGIEVNSLLSNLIEPIKAIVIEQNIVLPDQHNNQLFIPAASGTFKNPSGGTTNI